MACSTLVSWIGQHDLDASRSLDADGPIWATLQQELFQRVRLLYNYSEADVAPFLSWLRQKTEVSICAQFVGLSSPTHYGEIYEVTSGFLESLDQEGNLDLSILLSPGTPAMQSIWVLLGKTRFPAVFYQASLEQGVQQVEIPFDIAAEYIPSVTSLSSAQLQTLSETNPPANAAFNNIVTRSESMQRLIQRAQILAEHDVPVLINGESGTGKELFARAIHNASAREKKPFIAVNCGAFPPELIDSMLFGHSKGAFTGAIADKPGYFEQADGGILFLDEFGELEPAVQVRLLRVLQDKTYTRIGDADLQKRTSNFRLIAATNKNLMDEVTAGRFREDLFYRVAVGVLQLPALRQRDGDLLFLADSLLQALSKEYYLLKDKKISPGAKNVIQQYPWPGNVRELKSTLLRAALWAGSDEISGEDMQQALLNVNPISTDILSRDLLQGFDIQTVLNEVERHYINKARQKTGGRKKQMTEVLGYKSHQTLANRMKKLGIRQAP